MIFRGDDMRIIWIVIDSVGVGALPDADKYGDVGADTLGHIALRSESFKIDNLRKLGIGNIPGVNEKIGKVENPIGLYGKSKEISSGKDSVTGHFEMIGINTIVPFKTYLNGFPKDLMEEFLRRTGLKGYLGNKVASGTEIIKELGEEHEKTGFPIIYTSSDSVFQIAASEETFGLDNLYRVCEIARELLKGENQVARVIARPFIKENGMYKRTSNRHDYAIKPDKDNLLKYLKDDGIMVYAVGKINDLFSGCGITRAVHTDNNMDGVDKTLKAMDEVDQGLIFTNLVELDSTWGHRRDVKGYRQGLEDFDRRLNEIMDKLKEDDVLIINADHGCDPAFKGTDHTREYIPILIFGKNIEPGCIGVRDTFADIGATVGKLLNCSRCLKIGTSLL